MLALLAAAVALAAPPVRFDLDLQDADLHAAILLLAEKGDANVVIPDTVQGKVTVHLTSVTWDTALGAVLAAKGLVAVPVGDTLRITPIR